MNQFEKLDALADRLTDAVADMRCPIHADTNNDGAEFHPNAAIEPEELELDTCCPTFAKDVLSRIGRTQSDVVRQERRARGGYTTVFKHHQDLNSL
jgi:hypothetical protein